MGVQHPHKLQLEPGSPFGEGHAPTANEPPAVEQPRRPYDIDRLTDVALAVFAERGFDGASMDDVARAAGITKAAIYHHVTGKEELLDRGLRRALEALYAVLDEPSAAKGRPVERLRYIVRRVAELAIEVLPELTVLVRVRGNSETERHAIERRRGFDAAVTALVREAQAAGEFDATLEASVVVRLIFGMCNSIVEWYRPGGRLQREDIARALERIVFEGTLSGRLNFP
jgi:AcrR family transcriptional regulator